MNSRAFPTLSLMMYLMAFGQQAFAGFVRPAFNSAFSRIESCIEANEPVARTLEAIEKKSGKTCVIDKEYAEMYFILKARCNGTAFLFFPNKKICEVFQARWNEKASFTLDDNIKNVPNGVKNAEAYVVGTGNCIKEAIDQAIAKTAPYENVFNYCACVGGEASARKESEFTREMAINVMAKCASEMNPEWKKIPLSLDSLPTKQPQDKSKPQRSSENPRLIRVGMDYDSVMGMLQNYTSEKKTSGEYAWVIFNHRELLLYPDIEGSECKLTFHGGKLESCEGCSAKMIKCK